MKSIDVNSRTGGSNPKETTRIQVKDKTSKPQMRGTECSISFSKRSPKK